MTHPAVSVIVPVSKRSHPLGAILGFLHEALGHQERPYEILLAVDGDLPAQLEEARSLAAGDDRVRVLTFARMFGEGAALRAGLEEARGTLLLTHPAYFQVEAEVLPRLLDAVEQGADVAYASRRGKEESFLNRIQRWGFSALIRSGLKIRMHDVGCGVRALRPKTLEEVSVHGSFHRFLPVLAAMRGLEVAEVEARPHTTARSVRLYGPGTYARRLLDIADVYFLTKFTYKPLRFFGLVGGTLFCIGFLISLYLTVLKLFFHEAIGERPLFLLGVLLLAAGFQTFALGLLGELITFSRAAQSRPYAVKETLRKRPQATTRQNEAGV